MLAGTVSVLLVPDDDLVETVQQAASQLAGAVQPWWTILAREDDGEFRITPWEVTSGDLEVSSADRRRQEQTWQDVTEHLEYHLGPCQGRTREAWKRGPLYCSKRAWRGGYHVESDTQAPFASWRQDGVEVACYLDQAEDPMCPPGVVLSARLL